MTQQEFIHETKTRILHQHIEIIKNAIIQWGTEEFGSYVFHEHPRKSAEHEMTWYIADTRFRRVVLTWGDVDDNIEIRFVNNEYNVSDGMVSISPAAVVKGIGIDQYIEARKSLIKIVREALHKKKKEKEESKMNNKELISSNDLYDLVNKQYRRFLDEDHNNPLGHGITGDIRIERTSGNDDSKAFEEVKIILSKLNPNNCETIHLVKYRTSDHWRCCVDKLNNVFCKIYKDRVDREGYVCELFANPLVQNIITTVEEAIGSKETKEIVKEHLKEFSEESADSWLINKFNKLIGVLKTYCSEINQLDRHKRFYDTMSWDWSYMFNHNLLPPVTMTGDRYHYDYNPTTFKIFDMYDSNGDLMVNINHETFEINFYFYHSASEPFLTISANDYMGHIKHSYCDSHGHMDVFRFKYLIELIEKELKIQIINPFADPITTWKTGFVPDKDEMITTSLGIAKVSDYVTKLTGINKEDIYMATDEKKEKYNKIPIKDVQFNSKKKTTTVIFGEKTDPDKKKKNGSEEDDKKSEDIIVVSKCSPKDKFDPEVGLAMCIAKAYFGNRSKLEKAVAEWTRESEARDKKKAEDEKKKKAKQKKTKSTTTTKKKTGTRPGRPRKKSLDKKDKETVIKETEILDNKPNEVKVDDNTDNIIG